LFVPRGTPVYIYMLCCALVGLYNKLHGTVRTDNLLCTAKLEIQGSRGLPGHDPETSQIHFRCCTVQPTCPLPTANAYLPITAWHEQPTCYHKQTSETLTSGWVFRVFTRPDPSKPHSEGSTIAISRHLCAQAACIQPGVLGDQGSECRRREGVNDCNSVTCVLTAVQLLSSESQATPV
jgi:hypothetical protein